MAENPALGLRESSGLLYLFGTLVPECHRGSIQERHGRIRLNVSNGETVGILERRYGLDRLYEYYRAVVQRIDRLKPD